MDVENKENEQNFNKNYKSQNPVIKLQQNIKGEQNLIRPQNTLLINKDIQNDIEKQKDGKIILLDDDLDHPIPLESDFYDEGNERKEDIRNNFIKNKLKEKMKKEKGKEKNKEAYEVPQISVKISGQHKKDIQIEEEIEPIILNDIPINELNKNVNNKKLDIKKEKRNGLDMNIKSEKLLNEKMNNGYNIKDINGNNIIKKSENNKQINSQNYIQKSQNQTKLENRMQNKQKLNPKNMTLKNQPIQNIIEIKPKFISSKNDVEKEKEKEKENQLNINNIQKSINLGNKTDRINNKSINKMQAQYLQKEKSYQTINQIPQSKMIKKSMKSTNSITKIISISPVNKTQEIDSLKQNKSNIKEINNNFNKNQNQNMPTNYCTCNSSNNIKKNNNCQISKKSKNLSINLNQNKSYINIQNDNIHNHNYSINGNITQKELSKDKTIKTNSNLNQFTPSSQIQKPNKNNLDKNNFIKIQKEINKIPIPVNNGRYTEYQVIKKNIAPNMQFYNIPYNGTTIDNNRQNYNMRKNLELKYINNISNNDIFYNNSIPRKTWEENLNHRKLSYDKIDDNIQTTYVIIPKNSNSRIKLIPKPNKTSETIDCKNNNRVLYQNSSNLYINSSGYYPKSINNSFSNHNFNQDCNIPESKYYRYFSPCGTPRYIQKVPMNQGKIIKHKSHNIFKKVCYQNEFNKSYGMNYRNYAENSEYGKAKNNNCVKNHSGILNNRLINGYINSRFNEEYYNTYGQNYSYRENNLSNVGYVPSFS